MSDAAVQADPVLDLEKDFGTIVGDPIEKYEQNFARFNAVGEFVGYAPEFYRRSPPPKKVNIEADRARDKIEQARRQQEQERMEADRLTKASERLKTTQTVGAPSSIMEASRENAAARAAEDHADG